MKRQEEEIRFHDEWIETQVLINKLIWLCLTLSHDCVLEKECHTWTTLMEIKCVFALICMLFVLSPLPVPVCCVGVTRPSPQKDTRGVGKPFPLSQFTIGLEWNFPALKKCASIAFCLSLHGGNIRQTCLDDSTMTSWRLLRSTNGRVNYWQSQTTHWLT